MINQYSISRLFFVFFALLLSFLLPAQLFNFKKYNTKNGLANSSVKCLIQSRDGYLWFGTQGGGLSRFDGKQFKTFTKNNGLISNDITSLAEGKDGKIWIGTIEGLSVYDGKNFKNFSEQDGVGNTTIYNLLVDNSGNIWIPTDDKGLKVYRNNKILTLDTLNGLKKNRVFCVYQEAVNIFWVGTHKGGLYKVDSTAKIIRMIDSIPDFPKASVFCFSKGYLPGEIFAGSNNSGVFRIYQNKITPVNIPEFNEAFIGSLVLDKNKTLWIGTDGQGIISYTPSNHKLFLEKNGLSSNYINGIMEDYEGNIWIGTQSGGVNLLISEQISTYTDKDGLNNNKILSVLKARNGQFYVSTMAGGIYYFEKLKSSFQPVKSTFDLGSRIVTVFCEVDNNKLFCGTENNGVLLFENKGGEFRFIKNMVGFTWNGRNENLASVVKILSATNGNIWVATYGTGLLLINAQGEVVRWYRSGDDSGLSSDELLTIGSDNSGRLFVSHHNSGVQIFDGKGFIPISKNPPDILNTAWSFESDSAGRLFFGTQDAGLVIFKDERFSFITAENGICSNYIQSILQDGEYLWLGTDKGVNRIKLNEKNNIVDNRYYGVDAGLISPEITHNGIFRDNNDYLWFCTQDGGLARFDKRIDLVNLVPPHLLLLDIKLFHEHVNWSEFADSLSPSNKLPLSLELPFDKNHLTFNFRGITIDQTYYKFILENLDGTWSPYSLTDEAVYANIPPGTYTFRVVAKNSFGAESQPVSFTFTITPPFWRTWWFYTLCALFLGVGLFSFYRWRTAALEKEKRILEQKVEVRTKELKIVNENLSVALHDIKDSINYAERIQRAMLPVQEKVRSFLPESFIFLRPRDVVSGDFYWFNHKNGLDFVVAADCTGHGVPGAFMSMVGSSLLNEIVLTKGVSNPSDALTQLNIGVQNALRQKENQTRDGMDMAFCTIDYTKKELIYAGANRALWIVRKHEENYRLEEIKPTKCAIGGFTDENQNFQSHRIQLNPGDSVYLHSDGFADQFGGPDGKKLMTKRFKEILLSIQHVPLTGQGTYLSDEIDRWMSTGFEQVDDMLVIGLRF